MKNNRPAPREQRFGGELNGRKILLGVTGGIASYKAVELARLFIKAGARVHVVMTEAATKFVAPLTFESVTARHVYVEMFPPRGDISPWHTELATWPDIVVVAPTTANHMAKLAAGIADDLLTTINLTVERQRVLCPAMNPRMWANPATQENLATLKRRGYRVIMPEAGQMARPGEDDGVGRLVEPEAIYREVRHILSAPQDLRGMRVLVTAGRTEESWDPVRVLTNRASGRMGFALAEEARERGAEVMLIHGPTDVVPPTGVRIRKVTSAAEMAAAVRQEFSHCNILLMSAAVADYTFADTADHKIKKGVPQSEVKLVATEDILKSLSAQKGNRIIVGFALETENLLDNALRKLREKHLDMVVANNPLAHGSGFAVDTNQVLLIHRSGKVSELPLQSKREVAREILNAIIRNYRNPEPELGVEPEIVEEELLDDSPDVDGADNVINATSRAVTRQPQDGRRDSQSHHHRGKNRHGGESRPVEPQKNAPATAMQPQPAKQNSEIVAAEPAEVNGKHDAIGGAVLPVGQEKKKGKTRRGGRRQKERLARLARRQAESQGAPVPTPPVEVAIAPVVVKEPVPVTAAAAKRPGGKRVTAKPPIEKETVPAKAVAKKVEKKKTAKPKRTSKKAAAES